MENFHFRWVCEDRGHTHFYPAIPFLRFIPQQYLNKWTELMQNVSSNTIAHGSIKTTHIALSARVQLTKFCQVLTGEDLAAAEDRCGCTELSFHYRTYTVIPFVERHMLLCALRFSRMCTNLNSGVGKWVMKQGEFHLSLYLSELFEFFFFFLHNQHVLLL